MQEKYPAAIDGQSFNFRRVFRKVLRLIKRLGAQKREMVGGGIRGTSEGTPRKW